jgi:hypothetical protein
LALVPGRGGERGPVHSEGFFFCGSIWDNETQSAEAFQAYPAFVTGY